MPPGQIQAVGSGRFQLRQRLGGGAAADVFRALDTQTGHHCAVKLLKLPEDQSGRFRAEGRVMFELDHENVLRVLDFGKDPSGHWIAMSLAEGGSLKQLVLTEGPLDVARAADFGWQILRGLAAAHEHGVVHRDVKPSNILLDAAKKTAYLADFGIARFQNVDTSFATGSGHSMGSAGYAAPEQRIDARSAEVPADLYAVGATLYFLLTATAPHVLALMPERERALTRVPEGLRDLVRKATNPLASERYDSAESMATALCRARDEACPSLAPVTDERMKLFALPAPAHRPESAPLGCLGRLLGLA